MRISINTKLEDSKVSLIFAFKKPETKLASYVWALERFATHFNPKFIVLVDVGITIEKDSILNGIMVLKHDSTHRDACLFGKIEYINSKQKT